MTLTAHFSSIITKRLVFSAVKAFFLADIQHFNIIRRI